MRRSIRWKGFVVWMGATFIALGLVGCFESAESEIRDQASSYLNCPENAIDVAFIAEYPTGGGVYRAVGCNRTATYLCRGDKKAFDTEFSCCNAATCTVPPP